ncbi:MAG: DUF308 domain-containing protein [Clostridia bacterium]|nr:DUF308 domain-containing protein [Clostridia bacterium]
MLEKILKRASWSDMVISAILIILGLFLAVNPGAVTTMLSVILGGIVIAIGAFKVIEYIQSGKQETYLLGVGAFFIVAGIVIMFATGIILTLFRIIIGAWIIYTGIMNLNTAAKWKDYQSRVWLATLIGAIATIIAGIFILVNSGVLMSTIGVLLIIYGTIDIVERFVFIRKIENYLK